MKVSSKVLIASLIFGFGKNVVANDEWQFEVSPYLWGVSQSGDTGIRNVKGSGKDLIAELDMGFSDIFKNLDSGFLINGAARKGDWLIFADSIYMKVKVGHSGTGFTGVGENSISVTAREQLMDLIAGYRTFISKVHNFYTYAGIRYADIETSLYGDFNPIGIPELGFTREIKFGDSWVDPIVGAYSEFKLNPSFTILTRAEIGGFGVGSDFSWLASIGVDHKLNSNWSLKYSFRYLSVDYDDNDFVFDVNTNGLLLGATYKF